MRKKFRNQLRKATMANFSKNILYRYILIEDSRSETTKIDFNKEINDRLWYAIQEVNAITYGRTLPYVHVIRAVKDASKIRVIINDNENNSDFNTIINNSEININDLSHLINFKTLGAQRVIKVSDELVKGDAKLLVGIKDQKAAAVDIFLDIAMFNSYSFLRNLPLSEKREFNRKKYDYFKKIGEESYYLFSEDEPPSYYSFAFSARETTYDFNYAKYVDLWNDFISSEYKTHINENFPPHEQLKLHRDYDNLPDRYKVADFWDKYDHDYLLLRINQRPNQTIVEEKILNYFGLTTYNIGETKLVDIKEYFNPFIRKMIDELIISAFKIVGSN